MKALTAMLAGIAMTGAAALPAAAQEAASSLTVDGAGWRSGPPLEAARAGLSAAELDGMVYVAGGSGVVAPRADFEAYDAGLGRWLEVASMPVGLERMGMTAAAGRIWVAGGYSEESGSRPIAEMWSYDPEANVWQTEPPMPGAKASFALVSDGERLIAVGGENGAGGVFEFDLEARIWSAIEAPESVARRGGAAVMSDGKLWFIGGASQGAASAQVDVYDPVLDAWSRGPDLPAPRAGHAAAAHDGVIHVLGGRSESLTATLDTRLELRPGASSWTEARLTGPRTEAAAAVLGGDLMLIGGGAGAGFFAPFTAVNTVDILSPGGAD
jgi:N-acetylneuraminic acid mutarotase